MPDEISQPTRSYADQMTFSDLMESAAFEVSAAARAYSDDPGKQKRKRMMYVQSAIDILNVAMGSL